MRKNKSFRQLSNPDTSKSIENTDVVPKVTIYGKETKIIDWKEEGDPPLYILETRDGRLVNVWPGKPPNIIRPLIDDMIKLEIPVPETLYLWETFWFPDKNS